jgi:hypothetical protein
MSIFKVEEVSEDAFFEATKTSGNRTNPEYAPIYRRIIELKPHNGNNQAIKIDGRYDDLRKLQSSALQMFNTKVDKTRNGFLIRCKLAKQTSKDIPSILYIRKVEVKKEG